MNGFRRNPNLNLNLILIVVCWSLFTQVAFASRKSAALGHVFVGVSTVYFPGAIRIGGKAWEFGSIYRGNPGVIGIVDLGGSSSALLGAGIGGDGAFLYGALMWEFYQVSVFDFRFEAGGLTTAENKSEGRVTLGLSISF